MTDTPNYDIVVIGGGPGGYATALHGAAAGLSVAVVEQDKVGGTCLHRGCIPAKHALETAAVYRTVGGAKEFGVVTDQPALDFAASQARKDAVVGQLWKGLSGLLRSRRITVLSGSGTLRPGRVVGVQGPDGHVTELTGRHVVLASGSVPRTLPGFDVDGKIVVTSDEVLSLDTLPSSAAVIGGGAIGCEFASMLADLGTQVTILEALPKILLDCDQDVADVVAKSFGRRGVVVRTGVPVTGHAPTDVGTTVRFGDGEEVAVDLVVLAVGRSPRSDGLGLGGTAVELDEHGFVRVDEHLRTAEPGVYAVGDLVSVAGGPHPQLAHVAFAEGIRVVRHILGEDVRPLDYTRVPWCVYCHPEVAFVGMSEAAARAAGYEIVVKKLPYAHNGRAIVLGETEGLVKVVAERLPDGRSGRILGVHMVGPWVTEQLGQAYLGVNRGSTPDEIAEFIQPHPSLSEQFGEAVLALTGRGLHA